jgi:hypothetical protein
MQGECLKRRRKLKFGLASFVALAATFALLVFATTAFAQGGGVSELQGFINSPQSYPGTFTGPDPQTTNIPYLAWAGEQLKLEKCYPSDLLGAGRLSPSQIITLIPTLNAQFIVEDWSGPNPDAGKPTIENGTVGFEAGTGDQAGNLCVKADISSEKPGLAIVKLVVTAPSIAIVGGSLVIGNGSSVILPKHQFLAGWLSLNNPTCTEEGGTAPTNLTAGGTPGLVACHVTGNLPMANNFAGIHGGNFVLPDDYEALADTFAIDNDPGAVDNGPGGGAAIRWDIHGTPTDAGPAHGGDSPAAICQPRTLDDAEETGSDGYEAGPYSPGGPVANGGFNADRDVVDNCAVATLVQFSSIYGYSNPAIGPFEPLQASYTQYSDGQINAFDAPMPSAKINLFTTPGSGFGYFGSEITESGEAGCVPIPPNTGVGSPVLCGDGATLASFAGEPALKLNLESRDGGAGLLDQAGQPDNLFYNFNEPYYAAYIPATARQCEDGLTSSGVDAPLNPDCSGMGGNNFPGINVGRDSEDASHYTFWEGFVEESQTGASNGCLGQTEEGAVGGFLQTPSGPNHILVWTDEHGDAMAYFYPGTGFVPGVTPNENGGCELGPPGSTIATANVQAEAKYPDQPVFEATGRHVSNVLAKNLISLRNKSLECHEKGAGDVNDIVCTATAIGITGAPSVGEVVCFSTAPLTPFFVVPVNGSTADNTGCGPFEAGLTTNSHGVAARFEFNIATGQPITVFARFTAEGIKRVCAGTGATAAAGATITPGSFCSSSSAPGTAATSGSPSGSPTTSPSSSVVSHSGPVTLIGYTPSGKTPAAKKAGLRIVAIRLVYTKQGRYLVVRVNGLAKSAHIRIVLIRKGHVVKTALRTVRTNRYVRVPNLKVAKTITAVRVTLVT